MVLHYLYTAKNGNPIWSSTLSRYGKVYKIYWDVKHQKFVNLMVASNYQMVVRQSLGNWQSLSTFRKESTKKFDLSWLISKVCAYWFSLISMGMSRFKLIVNQTFSVCKVEAKLHPSCLQVVPQATPKVAPNLAGTKRNLSIFHEKPDNNSSTGYSFWDWWHHFLHKFTWI